MVISFLFLSLILNSLQFFPTFIYCEFIFIFDRTATIPHTAFTGINIIL
jgi:hypothetical protein